MAAKLATGSNQFISSARVRKYAKLMGLPLERYYYSRTSTPFLFFNNPSAGFYSDMFLKSVDKSFSTQPVSRCFANGIPSDTLNKMLYVDTKTWLPDDLLVKADKMTMANSIELRVPFLDHKVLEFAASLPCNYKLRGLTGKYIAKRALRGRVPKAIINRPKAGFPVPYASWLRKELRQSVRDILFDRKTIERGYFQRQGVEALLSEEERYGGFSKEIFSLVVLELWHRSFLEST
jgi:asparagine synthase (glutamine-hydrolysing)